MRAAIFLLVLAACGGSHDGAGPDGGMLGDGGSDGSGSDIPPGCKGTSLDQDGVLDLDVSAVRVTGAVTVNGAAIPADARGTIRFVERTTQVGYAFSVASTYTALLAPGTYDVLFDGDGTQCSVPPAPALPCNDGPIKQNVKLTMDGALDLDIPAIQVSGKVTTRGGMALAAESVNRGGIGFVAMGQASSFVTQLGTTGAGTYAATLLPGTYDVTFAGNPALCAAPPAPQLPCNTGVVKHAAALTTSGVLDVDVPAVQVSGAVTVNGAPLGTESVSRGSIGFVAASTLSISLGTTGAGIYAATLVPGTYDVRFAGNPSLCAVPPAPQAPCNSAVIQKHVALTADGALDVDVPAAKVSGAVTINGAPLAPESVQRGAIGFVADGATLAIPLGTQGAGTYAATLVRGTYDVRFGGNPSLCAVPPAPQAPCNGGVIKKAVGVTADGVLDLDVPAVQVTGALTVNGAPLVTDSATRGSIVFATPGSTTPLAISLGTMGAATYAATLVPATYDVSFAGNAALCAIPPAPQVPCVGGVIRTGVAVMASGALDLDVPAIHLSGHVTLNGAALPDLAVERGAARFSLVGGSSVSTNPFDPTGPAAYAMTLVPGHYVVRYRGNADLCSAAPAGAAPPCSDQIITGCE